MAAGASARWWLEQESRALLTRLERLDYFAVIEPMVAAAAPSQNARVQIERFLFKSALGCRKGQAVRPAWPFAAPACG